MKQHKTDFFHIAGTVRFRWECARAWKRVRVVFIPKPTKAYYTHPKSFRPISLSNFMLKILERIVDRHIKEEVLIVAPLHEKEYDYRAGRLGKGSAPRCTILAAFVDITGIV